MYCLCIQFLKIGLLQSRNGIPVVCICITATELDFPLPSSSDYDRLPVLYCITSQVETNASCTQGHTKESSSNKNENNNMQSESRVWEHSTVYCTDYWPHCLHDIHPSHQMPTPWMNTNDPELSSAVPSLRLKLTSSWNFITDANDRQHRSNASSYSTLLAIFHLTYVQIYYIIQIYLYVSPWRYNLNNIFVE